ncbi:MAG: Crp/Fnr family transcriptional regulator, partial [Pseudomonadota bacterium]|nr:Crp/Fnr family transcriptional regulator [Pseudomonadota bacterium]
MTATRPDGSILEKSALFAGLDRKALDGLARLSRHVSLDAGQQLFQQGDASDGCYAVLEGLLKVSTASSEGGEALLAIIAAGDVIGEMGLIGGEPRSADVTALKPSSLAFLASRDFNRFADENPVVYRHMLVIVSSRLRASNDAFAAYQLLPLSGRLARVLLRLGEGFGQEIDGKRLLIRQKFTQTDLAKMTGSARENVNRQLNDWRADKLISRISGYYCIDNKEKLSEIA